MGHPPARRRARRRLGPVPGMAGRDPAGALQWLERRRRDDLELHWRRRLERLVGAVDRGGDWGADRADETSLGSDVNKPARGGLLY